MISRSHRFHGYRSIRGVYKLGSTVRGPLFSVKSLLNPKRKSYRLSVVVSRKVHKSAVARNRMRRRLYEAVRQLEADIIQPHDIVITVFNEAVMSEPHEKLLAQVEQQLRQGGVLARRVR
jgi:ribonuclease P protein component